MSAFVMETTGFDTLAQYLYDYATSNHIMGSGRKNGVLRFLGNDGTFRELYNADPETLGQAIQVRINNLLSANTHAVEERYQEEHAADYYEFNRRTILPSWSHIQVIKNLQCLRYQMSEGDVPETAIYKKLNTLIADLCEAYVTNTNEYDNANWGW